MRDFDSELQTLENRALGAEVELALLKAAVSELFAGLGPEFSDHVVNGRPWPPGLKRALRPLIPKEDPYPGMYATIERQPRSSYSPTDPPEVFHGER